MRYNFPVPTTGSTLLSICVLVLDMINSRRSQDVVFPVASCLGLKDLQSCTVISIAGPAEAVQIKWTTLHSTYVVLGLVHVYSCDWYIHIPRTDTYVFLGPVMS